MINEIKKDSTMRMQKTIKSLKSDFLKIRTGRAHTSLLDHITVDYYGSLVPLSQVGNVNAEDSRTLSINIWEKDMVSVVEKAIMNSDLGLNPATAGTVLRIPMPPLTAQRREELVKVVKAEAEQSKVAIRNIRRDANSHLKEMLKDKDVSEDEERDAEVEIQKITNDNIQQIDAILQIKQQELIQI
ncbi:MAG: ribosome recycling factor [Gammaproteobacteria bacterium]|nr:MAG: ribosome recycling factor [Gammaproteobacteria bacterium]